MKRVYLEITNSCNLNCPFCHQTKGHDFMSLTDIDNYTTQIKDYTNYIYLHVLGEPLIHPDFEDILSILDIKQYHLQLVTNGVLLNQYPNLLNHSCLRKLSISLHSINNLNIKNDYFKQIDKLIETNKDIYIELRLYDYHNLDNSLKKYLHNLEIKYGFSLTTKKNSYKLKDKVYIYFQDLFKWPDINDDIVASTGKCHGLIDQIAILANGDVTSCCLDGQGINSFGNLKKNNLKDILNSELYLNSLKNMQNHLFSLELCKHCSYHLRFDHNNN